MGLPWFSASICASSSAFSSIRSASFQISRVRSVGIMRRQLCVSKALRAAATALSTSALTPAQDRAICSPVAGFSAGMVSTDADMTHSPLISMGLGMARNLLIFWLIFWLIFSLTVCSWAMAPVSFSCCLIVHYSASCYLYESS